MPARKLRQHHDHFATRSVHVGSEPDHFTGAVVPSLSVATTFVQDGIGKHKGHEYARSSNPTRSQLEALLTSLETSPISATSESSHEDVSGGDACVFASGSAATAAMVYWVSLQREEGGAGGDGKGGGGHILAINDVYGGTARFLSRASKPTGVQVTYIDMEKAGEQGIRAALREDTKLVWLEVPTNPLFLVPPLPLIAKIVHSIPKENRPLVVVDSTFLSPFYCTPLIPCGDALPMADVVLTSLSKYSGGHSDLILGSLTVSPRTVQAKPHLLKGLRFLQNSFGATASPRDCHLMVRSLKTLSVRALKHGLNALQIAAWLDARPEVEDVKYVGLKSSKAFHMVTHLLSANAKRELEYLGWEFPYVVAETEGTPGTLAHTKTLGVPFGGMIGFRLKGASEAQTEAFMLRLRLVSLAESLGGVESLIEAPYGMTHASLPVAVREDLGITPNLVRLSVGIEDACDLIADLRQAFKVLA
ncbi:hypothetical protein JCM24511_08391 [Saitozyma sp. JCM 24511]|nr:hypothetical protein JCM24511_08391 [Saitozyma sp. JCM 24511]